MLMVIWPGNHITWNGIAVVVARTVGVFREHQPGFLIN